VAKHDPCTNLIHAFQKAPEHPCGRIRPVKALAQRSENDDLSVRVTPQLVVDGRKVALEPEVCDLDDTRASRGATALLYVRHLLCLLHLQPASVPLRTEGPKDQTICLEVQMHCCVTMLQSCSTTLAL